MNLETLKEMNERLVSHLKGWKSRLTTSAEPPSKPSLVNLNPDKCLEPPPTSPSSTITPPPSSSVSSPSKPDQPPPPPPPRVMESNRPMKYPYTLTAKVMQFPLRFYMNNVWMWKYYFVGVALSLPIFYKIGKLSYAPENVAKWEEIRRKEFSGGHH